MKVYPNKAAAEADGCRVYTSSYPWTAFKGPHGESPAAGIVRTDPEAMQHEALRAFADAAITHRLATAGRDEKADSLFAAVTDRLIEADKILNVFVGGHDPRLHEPRGGGGGRHWVSNPFDRATRGNRWRIEA